MKPANLSDNDRPPVVEPSPARSGDAGRVAWLRPQYVLALLILVVTIAIFLPAVSHPFMAIDDPDYITDHPLVPLGLTWAGTGYAFVARHSGNWHPLATLSHMADCEMFGLSPAGHHLVNILLHGLNATLLFCVLRKMTGSLWRSFFVAAFFALHPLRVESVAWISERKDVLCAFFFLLAIWAYVACVQIRESLPTFRRSLCYFLTLACFACALMSKPMAVTLPFVLLLLDYWPLRRAELAATKSSLRIWAGLLREKAPFFLLAFLDSYITSQVQESAMAELNALPLSRRVCNMFISYAGYLARTFWPAKLAVVYPYNFSPSIASLGTALVVFIFLSAFAWRFRRSLPWLLTGWLWFLGTLIPVIGLVQVGQQALADRYTYLPCIGIMIAGVWTAAALAGTAAPASAWRPRLWARRTVSLLAVATLLMLAIQTRAQLSWWKSSEKLMRHSITVAGPSMLAHAGLAADLLKQGRLEEAAVNYRLALKLDRTFLPAMLGLVNVYSAQGKTNEAERLCRQTLAVQPAANTHFALADLLNTQGRLDEAQIHYLQGLALAPYQARARINLGAVLARQNNLPAAREQFERALRLNPKSAEALLNLGTISAIQGSLDQAISQFQQALKFNPSYADAHNSLGFALARKGQLDEAVSQYRAALANKPGYAEAHFNLGEALALRGELPAARAEFETALKYQTNYARAHFGLAGVFAAWKQDANVVRHLREAVRLDPQWLEPLNNLAWLLATHPLASLRDGPESLQRASRLVELANTNDWGPLDTLAAADAENGQFAQAVTAAQRSLALAVRAGQTNELSAISNRLELYRKGLPYREP